jgi:hypothetical protein
MALNLEPLTITQKVFECISNILSITYFTTPLLQLIKKRKHSLIQECFSVPLIISIITNCFFWVIFGSKEPIWLSMIITNGLGFILNVFILYYYLFFYLQKKALPFIGYGLYILNVFVQLFYILHIHIKRDDNNDNRWGFVAMILNVVMYAAPFQNILTLFKKGKYDKIPIIANIIGFFATMFWFIYGILTQDKITMISNGVSMFVVFMQLLFWFFFYYKAIKRLFVKPKHHLHVNEQPIIQPDDNVRIEEEDENENEK